MRVVVQRIKRLREGERQSGLARLVILAGLRKLLGTIDCVDIANADFTEIVRKRSIKKVRLDLGRFNSDGLPATLATRNGS